MNRCNRYEQEGLLKLEKGENLDAHFSECQDCIEAAKAHQVIKTELKNMQQQWQAPQGWQDRIWEEISLRDQSSKRKWKKILPSMAAAAAAAFFILGVLIPNDSPVSISATVTQNSAVTRSLNAKPGDELSIDAEIGDTPIAELLVYRNDNELVLRCSDQPPCSRRGRHLRATIELENIGNYQPILVLSESILPELTQQLDADASLILESGARVELAEQISVY